MSPGCAQALTSGLRALSVMAAMTLVLNLTQGTTHATAEKGLLHFNSASQVLTAKPAQAPSAPAPAPEAKKTSEAEPITKPKKTTGPKEKKEVPKLAPGQRVNLNTASQEDLELLPGIGPSKAKAIIKGRPYHSPEDIMKIRGIKEGTYKKLKEFIIVK